MNNFTKRSNVDSLAESIIEVNNIAKKNGLHIWLSYGGLLGMIREKSLLPWNNDAELECHYEKNITQKFIKMVDELSLNGYNVYYYSTIGCLTVKKPGVVINVNCRWKEKDITIRPHEECVKWHNKKRWGLSEYLSHYSYWLARSLFIYTKNIKFKNFQIAKNKERIKIIFILMSKFLSKKFKKWLYIRLINFSKKCGAKFSKSVIPFHFFDIFISIDFYGDKITIPEKNVELLEFIYGKDWKTPMDAWSFYDDKNKKSTKIIYIDESWDYENADLV